MPTSNTPILPAPGVGSTMQQPASARAHLPPQPTGITQAPPPPLLEDIESLELEEWTIDGVCGVY